MSIITRIAVLIALSLALAACGVKGPLEPPPGEENKAATQDQSGRKPHEGFILDGLL